MNQLPGTVLSDSDESMGKVNEHHTPQHNNAQCEINKNLAEEIKTLMLSRSKSAGIFGSSWRAHLGFFMPYDFLGTENSFWDRLKISPTFKYLFAYDESLAKSLSRLSGESLESEVSGARITVQDVDSAVNNCALICALLLGVPASIIGDMVGNQDGWIDYMHAIKDQNGKYCEPSHQTAFLYSDFCLREFERHYSGFFVVTTISFFSALMTLITAVCYYMCRPSESCNNTSMNTLYKACTWEVRKQIREKRHQGAEQVDPDTPFNSWGEELEVFMKAKFMAKNEAEEQKNQEFYMWYKSKKSAPSLIGAFFICTAKLPIINVVKASWRADCCGFLQCAGGCETQTDVLCTGGRVFILGVFFGSLVTIFCASFCINVFVLRWFTVTSDTSKVPRILRENLFRLAWDFNTISNTVGFLMCATALYICV